MSNRNAHSISHVLVHHGPNFWVVRRGTRFSVKEEGDPHWLTPPMSQWAAIRIARMLARLNHSELIVQSTSARIRFRDSHGFDPFPPCG